MGSFEWGWVERGRARRLRAPDDVPAPRRLSCSGREGRLELGLELALRVGADDLLGDRAVLEEDQRRDREDLVGHRGLLVLVDVELDDLQRLALLAGDLLEYRSDHAARSTPRR